MCLPVGYHAEPLRRPNPGLKRKLERFVTPLLPDLLQKTPKLHLPSRVAWLRQLDRAGCWLSCQHIELDHDLGLIMPTPNHYSQDLRLLLHQQHAMVLGHMHLTADGLIALLPSSITDQQCWVCYGRAEESRPDEPGSSWARDKTSCWPLVCLGKVLLA